MGIMDMDIMVMEDMMAVIMDTMDTMGMMVEVTVTEEMVEAVETEGAVVEAVTSALCNKPWAVHSGGRPTPALC